MKGLIYFIILSSMATKLLWDNYLVYIIIIIVSITFQNKIP